MSYEGEGWMSDKNRLHMRSMQMLTAWWKWYGDASRRYPDLPLPPAGTVELAEDIAALFPPPFPSGGPHSHNPADPEAFTPDNLAALVGTTATGEQS